MGNFGGKLRHLFSHLLKFDCFPTTINLLLEKIIGRKITISCSTRGIIETGWRHCRPWTLPHLFQSWNHTEKHRMVQNEFSHSQPSQFYPHTEIVTVKNRVLHGPKSETQEVPLPPSWIPDWPAGAAKSETWTWPKAISITDRIMQHSGNTLSLPLFPLGTAWTLTTHDTKGINFVFLVSDH